MNDNESLKKRGDAVLVGCYSRYPVAMVSGSGCYLSDADGRRYLDFLSGIAVCALGHNHPRVTEAISSQARKLVHVSNLYYTRPQIELAELICANSFAEKVFFCNSGAEANEAAIKLARISAPPERYKIISLAGSFHGRTLATLTATGQTKIHKGFAPLPEGFCYAPFADLAALEAMIDETTCAVLCEPLQGEGGVRPLDKDYLHGIRSLCDRHGLLLIFDEIQTGIGRTGSLFAHEQLDVVPDIMTLAKALGNGLPIGALATRNEIAKAFAPGTHGSTFGGNPVACAAAVATVEELLKEGFLAEVSSKGAYFRKKLDELSFRFPDWLAGCRGMGLLVGAVLTEKAACQGPEIVSAMLERGYLLNFAGNAVLRFAPPLIVTTAQIDSLIDELADLLSVLTLG
ncbi:MAG: aspartate aminotransferase family protein [Desulfobacterales bacterium]|nr:MAG: aspartate aminotransferase family protein [Desulfobacterales bacterium]